jgi:hypothetical protein
MDETTEPRALQAEKPQRKLPVKISDIIIFAVIIAVIAGLVFFITTKLQLKHDVAAARIVSDKVIADIQKRDGAAAYRLGTPTFQSSYTADQLTKQFKAIEIATLKAPSLDRQVVADGSSGRTVFFIYRYSALKVPYFIRTAIQEKPGNKWQLINITGNADESQL